MDLQAVKIGFIKFGASGAAKIVPAEGGGFIQTGPDYQSRFRGDETYTGYYVSDGWHESWLPSEAFEART
jgi:hypothetical protein